MRGYQVDMKILLKEMPHIGRCICPVCGFKFGLDAEIERLTNDITINQKFMQIYFLTKFLSFACPRCAYPLIHDSTISKTYKYEDIIKIIQNIEDEQDEIPENISSEDYERLVQRINSTISPRNLLGYLKLLKDYMIDRLELGRTVWEEKYNIIFEHLYQKITTQTLTFQDFVRRT